MKIIYIRHIIIGVLLLLVPSLAFSFVIDRDSIEMSGATNNEQYFTNEVLLNNFFRKLSNMELSKHGKINIVQIGDSHIQAGFVGASIRQALQNAFGDGGYGFSFPYELVRTNGPHDVRYVTNVAWESWPNTKAVSNIQIGLGGFALATSTKNFVLQLYSETLKFNKIKIIYPTQKPEFRLSVTAEPLKVTSVVALGGKTHKIKNGESLSTISRKYGVSVAQIRKANNMRNDKILAGKVLKIPSQNTIQVANVKMDENVEFAAMEDSAYYSIYSSSTTLNRLTFFPQEGLSKYTINGFVLENNKPGIIYHSIGVNGAHMSDYCKYSLFFKQLAILNPDLVIVSLGTNESFARMATSEFMRQMDDFIFRIKQYNKNAVVVVMTPPPSMFRRSRVNTYVDDYTLALTSQLKYPVWDLYSHMDGANGIKTGRFASMIGRDKIHYNQKGYELQGYMFATDFINAYIQYKNQIER